MKRQAVRLTPGRLFHTRQFTLAAITFLVLSVFNAGALD